MLEVLKEAALLSPQSDGGGWKQVVLFQQVRGVRKGGFLGPHNNNNFKKKTFTLCAESEKKIDSEFWRRLTP